jgi:adenine C2-methylase RlmN of 23S rRNA A2503 and tRNA A37
MTTSNLEIYRTQDGSVTKFVHADGSETAIKAVPSQSTFIDKETGVVDIRLTDRNKYSIFISSSTGCYLKCPFCHLTIKNSIYKRLKPAGVLQNIKDALTDELAIRPELGKRFVKICWMGMGDAINQPDMVYDVTIGLLDWIMANGYAVGLDSVDVSTVMPNVADSWIGVFSHLNKELSKYPLNPDTALVEQAEMATHSKYTDRSLFRLFYSLHSASQTTRNNMVPNTTALATATMKLKLLQEKGVSVLFHQLFVEGLNDKDSEIDSLVNYMNTHFPDNELRILRYNFCDRSPYKEWESIIKDIGNRLKNHEKIKIQTSAGAEVQAACGQFLVAQPRPVRIVK